VWAHAIWGEAFPSLFEENWDKYISLKKGNVLGTVGARKKSHYPNMNVLWDMRSYLEIARDALGAYSTIEQISSYLSAT
jgi:hypothetical protein